MNWYFASGDTGFFWKEQLSAFSWLPQVFQKDQGFGFNGLLSLWLGYPFRLLLKLLSTLGLSWFIIEKLLWLSVFVLAIYSSYRLAKLVLGKGSFTFLAPVVYTANTYFLLLFAGGQLGVALAYALAPLVLLKFIEFIDNGKDVTRYGLRVGVKNGLWFALLMVFDLRLAYLVLAAIILYAGLKIKDKGLTKDTIIHLSSLIIYPLLIAASVHLYWILPTVFASHGTAGLGEQFTNPGMLKFLSFADFSHALSLLHPNWPENLFGKVYFLQPEFLIIPLLAFASLAWKGQGTINNKHLNRLLFTAYCPFFMFLALVGAFFSKGVNDPFGGMFSWMFVHVPGFVMFRDPTKFYLYIALGYSVLIPFTLHHISNWINDVRLKMNDKGKVKNSFIINHLSFIMFFILWLFTLRGFIVHVALLPQEYVELKNMLVADPVPSRTLWVPARGDFAFSSDTHPILTATSAATIDPSVKYVIVPQDLGKRIFLNDYTFDPTIRQKLVAELSRMQLVRDTRFHDLAVFENPSFSGMKITVPADVAKQQEFANVGVIISALFAVGWLALEVVSKSSQTGHSGKPKARPESDPG